MPEHRLALKPLACLIELASPDPSIKNACLPKLRLSLQNLSGQNTFKHNQPLCPTLYAPMRVCPTIRPAYPTFKEPHPCA